MLKNSEYQNMLIATQDLKRILVHPKDTIDSSKEWCG